MIHSGIHCQQLALSRSGARTSSQRRPIVSAATLESLQGAVGTATSFKRALGLSDRNGVLLDLGSLSHTAARSVAFRGAGADSDAAVITHAPVRRGGLRPSRVRRRVRLVSRAGPIRGAGAAQAAVMAAPLGGCIDRAWLLANVQWTECFIQHRSGRRRRRRTAVPLMCDRHGSAQRGTAARRLAGGRASAMSRTPKSADRSFERPSNTALQPSNGAVHRSGTHELRLALTYRRRDTGGAHARTPVGTVRG